MSTAEVRRMFAQRRARGRAEGLTILSRIRSQADSRVVRNGGGLVQRTISEGALGLRLQFNTVLHP